jgi:hypothetical protein
MKIKVQVTCGPLEGEQHTLDVDHHSTFVSLLQQGGHLYNLGANYEFHDPIEFRFEGAILPPHATAGSLPPSPHSAPVVYLVRARQPPPQHKQQTQHIQQKEQSVSPPSAPAISCPVCMEEATPDALARLQGCSCEQCRHCVFASMLSSFRTSDASIFKCQMPECVKKHGVGGRTLEGDEVRQFLQAYAQQHRMLGSEEDIDPATCSCGGGSRKRLAEHSRSCTWQLATRMQHHQEHVLNLLFFNKCKGHVVCPCGRDQMIDPALVDLPTAVPCPSCSESFCSCCKRKPFHHNLPCNRVEDVRSGYLQWCNERRQAVLQHLQTMDARFKMELKRRDQKVQEELERLQQLRGVMCCPHCNHPCGEVGDLRCGKFICGRLETDSAASAVAGGCGREFRSSDALPFRAELPAALQQPLSNNIAKWTLRDGQPLRCECCGNQVEGPLLQCVGCNGLNVCIRCEAKGHEHVRSSSERPCHNESHYFIIRMNPDTDFELVQSLAVEPSAAAAARHIGSDPDTQMAHVFREDGTKTQLRSRATTSRDEDAMAVPKVEARV